MQFAKAIKECEQTNSCMDRRWAKEIRLCTKTTTELCGLVNDSKNQF